MPMQFLIIGVDVDEGAKRPEFQITSRPSVHAAREWLAEEDFKGMNPFAMAKEMQALLDGARRDD